MKFRPRPRKNLGGARKIFPGRAILCKLENELYEDAILRRSVDHIHQTKWLVRLDTLIVWEEVWDSVHNFLSTNITKTAIWEQIHLNFYTQYSYNKWHGSGDACLLCGVVPGSIFHIILECDFVNALWVEVDPVLLRLCGRPVTDEEKALGLVNIKKTAGMVLRNWLTYKMREQVLGLERRAYYSSGTVSLAIFGAKFNQSVATEIQHLLDRFESEGKMDEFDKFVACGDVLCEKVQDGEYRIKKVFV